MIWRKQMKNRTLLFIAGIAAILCAIITVAYSINKIKSMPKVTETITPPPIEKSEEPKPDPTIHRADEIPEVSVPIEEDEAKVSKITFHGNKQEKDVVFVIEYTNITTQIYTARLVCDEFNEIYDGEITSDGSILFYVDDMKVTDYVATITYDSNEQLGTVAHYVVTKDEYDEITNPKPMPRDAGPDPFYDYGDTDDTADTTDTTGDLQ